MMNAIKTAERKLANGTLRHAGSGLMAWAVGNLKIEPTATAIRATKQNAGDAKIDPVMALFDAVVPMSQNPDRLTPNGTDSIDYFRALVMSKRSNVGSADNVIRRTFSLGIDSAIVSVDPT